MERCIGGAAAGGADAGPGFRIARGPSTSRTRSGSRLERGRPVACVRRRGLSWFFPLGGSGGLRRVPSVDSAEELIELRPCWHDPRARPWRTVGIGDAARLSWFLPWLVATKRRNPDHAAAMLAPNAQRNNPVAFCKTLANTSKASC